MRFRRPRLRRSEAIGAGSDEDVDADNEKFGRIKKIID